MLPTGGTRVLTARTSEIPDRVTESLEKLLLISAAAAIPVFVFAGSGRSLWLDEANSVYIASGSLHEIFGRLRADNNFPVYSVLLHFWALVFGDSEAGLRLLSGIAYLAGTVTVYWGGRTIFRDRRAALYAMFCYLVSTQAIRQAQNVRMYTLLGCLSALSTVFFCLICGDKGSKRGWVGLAAVNIVGSLTHVWFAFLVAGQCAAAALWRPRFRRRLLLANVASYLPFLLLWSPALYVQLHNGATRWMPPFKPVFIAHAVMDYYGGPYALPFYMICAGFIFYPNGRTRTDSIPARLLLTCFAISLALPLAVSIFKPIFWPGRYTIIGLAPLALWLGWMLAQSTAQPAISIFCLLTLAIVLAAHIASRDVNPESNLPESQSDRAAARLLLQVARPGDQVIFTSLSRATIDYYLRRGGAQSRFLEIGFPGENSVHLGWGDTSVDASRLPLLQAEAERDIAQIAGMPPDSHVWVFYGYDRTVAALLRKGLDRRLKFEREFPLTGPYYSSLLEYRH